jgi:outer membrane cobalamin receptor
MKTMKNWLLTGLMFLIVATAFAQGKVTGTVTDGKGSLPGANIVIKGTKIAVSTDFDGKFSINTTANSGELVVSFIGYKSKTVKFNGAASVGTIALVADDNQLQEIVVRSSVVDVAKDRKTPVAVSTIRAAEIQEKLGSQEFPEILANTPSVYATKAGGGFGDSRINIRGFDQKNIAVLINGVPVNDMENSAVYWSNWAGLSDVTSAMQVQRGLGSSKLAISSVGGTINVVTRSADMKEGGSVSVGVANNNYLKKSASYSTGVMKNGLSASVLLSQTTGNGYVDGTKFEGANYFIGIGYKINAKHDVEFTFTGAPQWHNQRNFANTLADYIKYGNPSKNEPNIKYNSDWGYLNGEEYSWATNFYHKPVMSLNWDYKINDKTKLSSVAYASWGRGGGTGNIGKSPFAYKTANGLVPFDEFVKFNTGLPNTIGTPISKNANGEYVTNRTTGFTRRASINSHDWFGAVINLNHKLSKELTLDFGVDARTYVGYHFRNINDRLGASVYYDNTDINLKPTGRYLYETYSATPSANPFVNIKGQEKIEYNNNGYVRWLGAFTQLEYTTDKLTAFFQGSVSQQGFKREDTFVYLQADPLYITDYKNLLGGNLKVGANYNINDQHNVFINSGYYSKQPFFNAVYPNNLSLVNEKLTNEKILGFEAGYGFRSSVFNANVNLYHTSWKDRNQRNSDTSSSNVGGYFDIAGITEVHSGVELDLNARVNDKFKVNGMFSFGNWVYKGDVTSNRFDQNNQPFAGSVPTKLYLDGVKVGDAAQTTASIGLAYEVVNRLNVDVNYRWLDKLYTSIAPVNSNGSLNFTAPIGSAPAAGSPKNRGSLELPSYGLVDAGLSYKMLLGSDKSKSLNFRLNINNVLDEVYIADGRSNVFTDMSRTEFASGTSGDTAYNTYVSQGTYDGVHKSNQVFFGFGRTWNFTMRYNF